MSWLIRYVTYCWPALTLPGECSLTDLFGIAHETAGNEPSCAAPTRLLTDWMLESEPLLRTVSKPGSGFQMLGVLESWRTGTQLTALGSRQSGSLPLKT